MKKVRTPEMKEIPSRQYARWADEIGGKRNGPAVMNLLYPFQAPSRGLISCYDPTCALRRIATTACISCVRVGISQLAGAKWTLLGMLTRE